MNSYLNFIAMMFITWVKLTTATDNGVVGINWSPFHHPSYDSSNKTAIQLVISEDFERISGSGFELIRTFYAKHGSSGVWVAPYAQALGMKLALGVYMYPGYDTWTAKQMDAAAGQAAAYPDTIMAIFMGNENVYKDGTGDYTPSEMIDYIQSMKSKLEEYNVTNVPVGTVQRYTEWNSGYDNISQIADECDIIGANIYPFYVDIDFDQNIDKLESMVSNIQNYFPNKTLWITETGFPSGGTDCSSNQETSVDKTESYFNSVKDWASNNTNIPVYYFQYFDKETSANQNNICNNFFGLADAEGNPKFDF